MDVPDTSRVGWDYSNILRDVKRLKHSQKAIHQGEESYTSFFRTPRDVIFLYTDKLNLLNLSFIIKYDVPSLPVNLSKALINA